ncbi:MAG: hypothetical protein A2W19_08320 [Spirochaetes bacterium RBG_16_49_21]|nr:MAG: hypothetical protein A2W19_08320 [Spirochaetes bacterium RBG_16_49_21]
MNSSAALPARLDELKEAWGILSGSFVKDEHAPQTPQREAYVHFPLAPHVPKETMIYVYQLYAQLTEIFKSPSGGFRGRGA